MSTPKLDASSAAYNKMGAHSRKSIAAKADELVAQWREERVYPYAGGPKSASDETTRKLFDLTATTVNKYLPAFRNGDAATRRLTLALLRHTLEHAPRQLGKVMNEVIAAPERKCGDLVSLLGVTNLAHHIGTSSLVADRIQFLKRLESLVMEQDGEHAAIARSQLLKIVAGNTWILGEQYHLSVNDRSLTQVLRKHADIKGLDIAIDLETPVLRDDGSKGVIDLMFSRNTQFNGSGQREHLIVELKRPTVPITMRTMSQIHSYARAVAGDERCDRVPANWVFWAVSSEIDDQVRDLITGDDKQPGIFHKGSNPKMTIWAKTWSEIINDCKVRLEFFAERLEYTPDEDASIKHLRDVYGEYLDNVPLRKAQARG